MSESGRIIEELHKMFDADEAYGCGFYSQHDWRASYERLKELSEWEGGNDDIQ